ncbi:MAG TPA: hypothetical protein DDW27_20950 [Bacteroidales bacterium]|nr:hypothetical protein [Bacteroidales bacterium]
MVRIIGIDGLDKSILERYIDELPVFKKISREGVLSKIESVFPADSVPAWITIFTGLNPAEHGIIRGKDYIESVESFENKSKFKLQGKTFWDVLSEKKYKCLVINPFLAYPSWEINGIMESGPAFITGDPSLSPDDTDSLHPEVLGGYSPVAGLAGLKADMETIFSDTLKLWEEYEYQSSRGEFDLEFVTFTTLDRLMHYTWRYNDENDPLHEKDEFLSGCTANLLKLFDRKTGELISKMNDNDFLILISDHGFRQRPFNLINLNEYLRLKGFLTFRKEVNDKKAKRLQILKKNAITYFSKLKILDLAAKYLRNIGYFSKLKKSDYLIDKENSICYTDEMFSGKKPYVGLNFGEKLRNAGEDEKNKAFQQVVSLLNNDDIPRPVWIKRAEELYQGEYQLNMPDICIEFPYDNGIEFNYFGELMEKSATHYRISGGHFGSGTFGFYCSNKKMVNAPDSLTGFAGFVKDLFK